MRTGLRRVRTEREHLERDAVVREERDRGGFSVRKLLVQPVVSLGVEASLADAGCRAHDVGRDGFAFTLELVRLFADDVIDCPLAGQVQDVARGRHEVLLVAGEADVNLRVFEAEAEVVFLELGAVVAFPHVLALEMLAEPQELGLLGALRPEMRAGGVNQLEAVTAPERIERLRGVFGGLVHANEREEVGVRGEVERGAAVGGEHEEREVVHAVFELSVELLLGVAGAEVPVRAADRGDEAGGRGRGDALVHRHDVA